MTEQPGPRSYLTYSSGNLFAVRYLAEERTQGQIAPAPKLFVVWYDEQFDEIKIERITWSAARVLARDDVAALGVQMSADRAAYALWAAEEAAAGRPRPVAA